MRRRRRRLGKACAEQRSPGCPEMSRQGTLQAACPERTPQPFNLVWAENRIAVPTLKGAATTTGLALARDSTSAADNAF